MFFFLVMRIFELILKARTTIVSHNEFLPEENEYDDDDNNNTNESHNQLSLINTQISFHVPVQQ
jgi:hypothetical protein